jgi:hypothetical protein
MFPRLRYAVVLMPLVLGCGGGETSITGTVTVDGHPLQDGYITFFPTQGGKNTCGAQVIDGKYQIEQIPPGPRRVVISGTPEATAATSAAGPPTLRFLPSANYVAPRAVGNQKVVEIESGTRTLNFDLVNPKTSATR